MQFWFYKKVMFVVLKNSGISPAAKWLVVLKEGIYSMDVVVVRGVFLGQVTICWCWQMSEGTDTCSSIRFRRGKKRRNNHKAPKFLYYLDLHIKSPRYKMLYNWICLYIIHSQQTCLEDDTDRQTDLTCAYFHLYETQRLTYGANIWPRHADYICQLQHASRWMFNEPIPLVWL